MVAKMLWKLSWLGMITAFTMQLFSLPWSVWFTTATVSFVVAVIAATVDLHSEEENTHA